MEILKMLETLSPHERDILPFIKNGIELKDITKASGNKDVEVMRAVQWLENKKIIKTKSVNKNVIEAGINGEIYIKKGLPEKRFLSALNSRMSLKEIGKKAGLDNDETRVCLGILKSRYAITILGGQIEPTGERNNVIKKGFPEEEFLKKLPMEIESLSDQYISIMKKLLKRKDVVRKNTIKLKYIELTSTGKKLLDVSKGTKIDLLEKLTPTMLKNKSWEKKKFRRYDVETNVPRVFGGKRHFVNQAVNYVKRVWMDMGFKEMSGPMLQTSFWNFDALFTAQDHPVRDLQDTFYVKNPQYGKLPDKNIVNNVKKTHENGWTTGSKGWQYKWDINDAKRNCMRTHTTCLSAKTISLLKSSDLPAKFFAVGKCFRNETMDWSHLFEFYQVEGIVIDQDANFKHLLGYLTNFFRKMGYEKIRIRPGYFPYTEMSAEVDVYDKRRGRWIELAGSGMFRPEVVKPILGKDVPVIAWGLGFPRTISDYYKIKDIRNLYKNDIKQLREMKTWMV